MDGITKEIEDGLEVLQERVKDRLKWTGRIHLGRQKLFSTHQMTTTTYCIPLMMAPGLCPPPNTIVTSEGHGNYMYMEIGHSTGTNKKHQMTLGE